MGEGCVGWRGRRVGRTHKLDRGRLQGEQRHNEIDASQTVE